MPRTWDRSAETPGRWGELIAGHDAESIERKTLIYTPGSAADALFVLVSGQVDLYLRSDEGRMLTLQSVLPGHVFGTVALANDGGYDTYAQATGQSRLYRILSAQAAAIAEANPALGMSLMQELTQYRAVVSHRIDEVAFKSVPARLASLLLELASGQGSAMSVPRHSHRQLAEMINAYRETVTKVFNQFRDARLLEVDRSTITLVNLRRLQELAQG